MIRKKNRWLPVMWIALGVLIFTGSGCDTQLEDAYENFLDNTPPVCKDYCEEQAACGRMSGTGDYEKEQFTSDVHVCEVGCAAYAAEGAYVWYDEKNDGFDRVLFDHLSGDEVMDVFDCMYGKGAYRCVLREGSYRVAFSPPARNICDDVKECVDHLGLNLSYSWVANNGTVGGTCQQHGGDFIDAVFF